MIRHCNKHDMYSQCTLYDCIEQYGYTMPELLGSYPIWDEDRREWLNNEIYLYFENREIGPETPQQFASYAGRVMNRVMPRVNSIAAFALEGSSDWQVSTSNATQQNMETSGTNTSSATSENTRTPNLSTQTDATSENTRTPNLTTQTDATSESKATVLSSDTPQVQLSGLENYMTQLNETGSEGESASTVRQTGTETNNGENTSTVRQTGTETDQGSTSGTSTNSSDSSSTGSMTSSGAQLSELASNWAQTMPDLLGLIFEALESCFVQVM